MPSCFGGASDAQTNLASQQANFANSLQQDMKTRFAGQNQTIGQLSSILQNVQNGKLLPGFDSSTLAALNTSAINSTAANYRNAAQATQNAFAGRGGDSGLETGIQAQVQAANANQGAGQLSSEQQKIQLANEQQAQQNTATAIGGYNVLAGIQNPLGFAGSANTGENQAFGQASTINELQNQQLSNELNFGTGLAMDAATFGAGGIGNLGAGESAGEGAGDFLSGGFGALSGK